MFTICWNNHEFEYLIDQTTCPSTGCGEFSQHLGVKRYTTREKEAIAKMVQETKERFPEYSYQRGFQEGFEKGIQAEQVRVKSTSLNKGKT